MIVIDFEKFRKEKQGEPIHTGVLESKPVETRHERIIKAMRKLHDAAHHQRVEVKKFQRVISDLHSEVLRLEKSCIRFDEKIRAIRIRPLRRAANRLVGIMDSHLATQTP